MVRGAAVFNDAEGLVGVFFCTSVNDMSYTRHGNIHASLGGWAQNHALHTFV